MVLLPGLGEDGAHHPLLQSARELRGVPASVTDFNRQQTRLAHSSTQRLIEEDRNSATTEWGYDAAGNRTQVSDASGTKTYVYGDPPGVTDGDNRLREIQQGGQTLASFEYDQNGAITRRVEGSTTTTHTYDAARRMTGLAVSGGIDATYRYDGLGARWKKVVSGGAGAGTTTYLNDTRGLTQVLQETGPDPSTGTERTVSYAPGLGQHSSNQSGNAAWAFSHADAHNNRLLTDAAGAVANRWEYDPFGAIRGPDSDDLKSDFGFAGEQRDRESSLVNLRARYYDPSIGRFVARDPLHGTQTTSGFPQTLNRFAYALNNPETYLDPSGYRAIPPGQCTGSTPGCDSEEYRRYERGGAKPSEDDEDDDSCEPGGESISGEQCDPDAMAKQYITERAYADCIQNRVDKTGCEDLLDDFSLSNDYLFSYDPQYRKAALRTEAGILFVSAILDRSASGSVALKQFAATVKASQITTNLARWGACSFDGDTLTETAEGPRRIVDVRVGDRVLAWNEAAGALGYFTVTATWSHLDPVILILWIDGERILTTPEHPFYVDGQGWVDAGELRPGWRVRGADGGSGAVQRVQPQTRRRWMYNLTVQEAHTYFVAQSRFLVHNSCLGGKRLWGLWNDYPKVVVGNQAYAQISGRLYTRHAVERMAPRGLGGRSVPPEYVEEVINTGTQITTIRGGVVRTIHRSGSVTVVTEGGIVVTVITH